MRKIESRPVYLPEAQRGDPAQISAALQMALDVSPSAAPFVYEGLRQALCNRAEALEAYVRRRYSTGVDAITPRSALEAGILAVVTTDFSET